VTALLTTNLGDTPLLGRGKVRDLYAVGDALLLVATDRISAFDHVLARAFPAKARSSRRFRCSGSICSRRSCPTT
jgi:phosphoribosylaminoimidazole-succinocarboxamide synthase